MGTGNLTGLFAARPHRLRVSKTTFGHEFALFDGSKHGPMDQPKDGTMTSSLTYVTGKNVWLIARPMLILIVMNFPSL